MMGERESKEGEREKGGTKEREGESAWLAAPVAAPDRGKT